MLPSSPTLLPTSGEGSFISSAYGSSVFLSFSRTAGEATMPVGAFYGQDGGELARRVSDHARKVRFMVKKGANMVGWTKVFEVRVLLLPEV